MIFKNGKFYKHTSGSVGNVVGKIKSLAIGKALVMEVSCPGTKTTLRPVGMTEENAKGWSQITRQEFIKCADRINKEVIETQRTQLKEDNCMRGIAGREKNDLHLVLLLECGHQINFDKNDIEPNKGSKFHCKECREQNDMIQKKLSAALGENTDA